MNELPSFFRPVHRDSLSEYIENWDFRPIQFGYWCESRGRVLKDNILNQYMLILMSQGQCQIQCQNGLFTLNQYDGVIIPPYLMYSVVCTSSNPVQCFYLGYEICNQRMKEQYAHLDSIANLQYLPGLAGASHIMRLRQMALDCQADKPGVFLQLRGMLNSCLIPLFAREAQGCEEHPLFSLRRMSHEQQLVLSCMKYINDNVTQNTTVAELCEQFHVSQSYLYRCFSHILHCSPNNWIRRYRIGKSLSSLRFSDRSISQTAEEFGFSSVYHYSRVFKEVMGKSPSIYRRALLAENQVT